MIKIKNNIIKNKRYKLYKTTFAVALATVIIPMAGCQNNKNYNYDKNDYAIINNDDFSTTSLAEETQKIEAKINEEETSIINNYNISESLISNEQLNNIILLDVNLSNYDYNLFNDYISKIDTNYPYEELYGIMENLSKYNELNKYTSNLNKVSYTISEDYIYNIVVKNNSKENFNDDKKISDQQLKKICKEISSSLNYLISKDNSIDINLLFEKIDDLKIINFTGFSNGSYDSTTGDMWLDVSKLNSDNSLFEKVIMHESVHLVQSNSLKELDNSNVELRLGCSYRFNNSKVNSLNWTWFSEGTAESIMMEKTNSSKALTYDNLIRIIETIKTSTVLNPNNNISKFEYISLDNDLSNLFEYFNCNTDSEKQEILNMMFSYELISGLSGSESLNEFYDYYKSLYGRMEYKEKSLFEKQIKGSIGQTLSKQFYKNLILSMNGKKISINEVFELISVFESEMNKQTWYSTTGYATDMSEFMINYVDIQDCFFEILSNKTGLTLEEIQNAYNTYNLEYNYDLSNLSMLSKDEKEFYNKVKENRKKDKTYSIRQVYAKEIESKKIK